VDKKSFEQGVDAGVQKYVIKHLFTHLGKVFGEKLKISPFLFAP
jgi:hypothetical protein